MRREMQKVKDLETLLERLRSDLHVCVGLIQEPKKLKDSVLMIYGRYAPNADTVERSSADGSQPLCHQHDHLEKTINSLQMKLVKSAKEHERIYVKIMKVKIFSRVQCFLHLYSDTMVCFPLTSTSAVYIKFFCPLFHKLKHIQVLLKILAYCDKVHYFP
ncbi:hypothetical protein ILYODFUR_005799 [Ilyodon furcidens]|uniref:Uncharacterized protein n=1 Tax=Ilyodon furcidens TaxID=33524 RepID=A0ABV0UGS9_9TELE